MNENDIGYQGALSLELNEHPKKEGSRNNGSNWREYEYCSHCG